MTDRDIIDSMYVALFFVISFITAFAPFVISYIIRPKTKNCAKALQPYECGIDPYGNAWDYRYGIFYYLYALIFLAFDVDILYLFPVASAFDLVSGIRGVVEFFIFIGILSLAIVYAWVKGVFKWETKRNRANQSMFLQNN